MDTRSISQSEINQIERYIDRLERTVLGSRDSLRHATHELSRVEEGVTTFKGEFDTYMDFDKAQKELALAKTKIVGVRQKLNTQFSHYDLVRRKILGILQALDSGLVNQNTIQECTEQLMVACPRYWLAPCLIALAAWIRDDKELANIALKEALSRDDEKTSLLFALICRRARRPHAVSVWLERYFGMQDPTCMERKMVIVLDAFSNGLFGENVREMCARRIQGWIDELSQKPGFVEEQVDRWTSAFRSKITTTSHGSYRRLKDYAENWDRLAASLDHAQLHSQQHQYFEGIFVAKLNAQAKLGEELDHLLDVYVSNFDAEELPLRREERQLALIIEEDGDVGKAQFRFVEEKKALDEIIDFTQLLTNAAMHPELSNATKATQKLAVVLSKDWMLQAYEDLTASHRALVPHEVLLQVDSWQGVTSGGENVVQLQDDARAHLQARRDEEIEQVVLRKMEYFWLVVGAVAGLVLAFSSGGFFWGLIVAGGAAWRFLFCRNRLRKEKDEIFQAYERLITQVQATIGECCEEVRRYREEYNQLDSICEPFLEYLQQITPDQCVQLPEDHAAYG